MRVAAAVATLTAALAIAGPVQAQGMLTGEGVASGAGCSGTFALEGMNASGATWSFAVEFAATNGVGCAGAISIGFVSGAWNPATGGCVPSGGVSGTICVGPVPSVGTRTVSVSFCGGAGSQCYNGPAVVRRTV